MCCLSKDTFLLRGSRKFSKLMRKGKRLLNIHIVKLFAIKRQANYSVDLIIV